MGASSAPSLSQFLLGSERSKKGVEKDCHVGKAGDDISYAEFYVSQSKPILDEIDRVLAQHYGFTDEELDFIINYDIKYRMGQDASSGEDDE